MQVIVTHPEPAREKGPPVLVFAARKGAQVYGARNARHAQTLAALVRIAEGPDAKAADRATRALSLDLYRYWVKA